MKKEVICKQCGGTFTVASWRVLRAKYCSYDCANKGRTTDRAYSKKRICEKCGKEFLPTQWNQKYCGRKCFIDSVRKRQKIKCPTCGRDFIQTRVSQKYCSRKCGEPFMKKPDRKIKKGYADLLWGDLVKLKAGNKCEYCGKNNQLNSHHIFSRSRMNLRWDSDNGICLCAGHHVLSEFSAHKAPIDFLEWLRDYRGEAWYERLREKSKVLVKFSMDDKREIIQSLKDQIEDIKNETSN